MDVVRQVLFISYDGMTDPLGQSQVLPYLKGLVKNGFQIRLISCEKKERFSQHQQAIQNFCDEAKIEWHPLMYTKKPPLLSTLKDINRIIKKAKQLYKEKPFEIVHARSYIPALVAMQLKKSFPIKILFDMRGFWADERVDGKIWNIKNPLFKAVYHYFKRKEQQFLSESNHIISLTENGKNEILRWKISNVDENKITVIPCCVNLELFDKSKIQEAQVQAKKQELGIQQHDYIVGYVGSIGTWYLLDEMLDYFKQLKKSKPSAKFLFVSGDQASDIQNATQNKKIQMQDILITSCLHKDVPLHISLFDESIFFIRPSYSKKASSPTKQGEIMCMGVPLVCNAGVGDTDLIVQQFNAGIVIKNLDTNSYEEAIAAGINYQQEETIKGAQEFFSLEKGVQLYTNVYKSILG